ncbi:MAG: gliding motility-associated C-terminal domain-containing protein, partial [Flavobacteriales bacterium]|nr:gliding motility-associated C-terminal domain-containing protein [Flavobacteriales bacterium]
NTPFALTATATDPDVSNVLSYNWEQTDNQTSTQPPVAASTDGPSFRSLSASTSTTRYFPNLADLMAGGPFTWEVLPSVNRIMNFRVTVRDNAGPLPEVSCSDIQDVTVTVDASSGPFVEIFPSAAGIIWTGATTETVTWNEAGTASSPVSCANVDILLSTDGGVTFPTVLASNVPNTGSNVITVPNITTTTAVVMIMCSNGTFFDISDNVFTINTGVLPPPPPSACVDTVFYPESKRTGFGAFQLISEIGNSLTGFSQTYNANTGVIHGVNAYVLLDTNGIVGDAPSKDVYIKVFNVDGLNRPVGAAIDSNLVTLTDVGTARQTLLFTAPVAVTGRYAVSVTLNPLTSTTNSDTIWFRSNDGLATPADGLGEGLLGLNLNFPGFGWTNFFSQFGSANYDALIAPIFDKTISSSYTTDVDTVCLGGDVVFTNTSSLDTNYMYNRWDSLNVDPWIWSYADGTGNYNHFDTTYTFGSGGTFNTQLLITNYGYTGNCVDSVQKIIEVIETIVIASTDTSVCLGDTVNLSVTGTATTYTWDNGLGIGQNQIATPVFDTIYVVTGTGIFSCTDTDTVNVTINALPSIIASVDTSICLGDTVNLSATGGTTYDWDNGLGSGQTQTAAPLVDTMYVVIGVDGNGCSNTDTVDVIIFSLPIVTASIDTTICEGDTVTISATSTEIVFNWDNGLGLGQSQQVFPLALTSYIVSVSDINSCVGVDSVTVSVNSLPILITNQDTSICLGDSINLFANGADTYTWDNGLGAGQIHLLLTPMDTTYIVTGVDINGCINTGSVVVTLVNLNIIASNDTSICFGISTIINATGATSYLWDNGLGAGDEHNISPTENITYVVTGSDNGCIGTDTVTITVDNMCFEIPNVFTPNGDGRNDLWNIAGLELFPDILVKVFNRWGDLVFESNSGYSDPWDGRYNGKESPPATYYYVIVKGDGSEGVTGTINIVR